MLLYSNCCLFLTSSHSTPTASLPAWVTSGTATSSSSADAAPVAGVVKTVSSTVRPVNSAVVARPRSTSGNKTPFIPTSKDDSGLRSVSVPPLIIKGSSRGDVPMTNAIQSQLSTPLKAGKLFNGKDLHVTQIYSGSKSLGSSPILVHKDIRSDSNPSQLSSTTSGFSSSFTDIPPPSLQAAGPAQPSQPSQDQSQSNPLSPLATSYVSARPVSSDGGTEAMPLAIAVIESCDAIFKGVDPEACVVRVTGEVSMSFLASFLPKMSSLEPLAFRVNQKEVKVGKLLHNQHLLKRYASGNIICLSR